jgi:glutaredoxin
MEDELMRSNVRFFTSKQCGFCRAAKAILDSVLQQFGDTVKVEEIDIDDDPRVVIEEGILALPVIIIGAWKFVGVPDKDDILTATLNAVGEQSFVAQQDVREVFQEGR